ncbi:hypothetical protein GCM10011410_24430 [Hoyosella rhizosphaerae]|uniref:Uncharacterized protein n=1 Tax=Hoyosella rhizosphaerae TaxID=1755582 RepID=A0A916UFC5_9ACTN|nr:hypothetical protein GCM10011410_24430 [Hoyosella rhizosphaerae]
MAGKDFGFRDGALVSVRIGHGECSYIVSTTKVGSVAAPNSKYWRANNMVYQTLPAAVHSGAESHRLM